MLPFDQSCWESISNMLQKCNLNKAPLWLRLGLRVGGWTHLCSDLSTNFLEVLDNRKKKMPSLRFKPAIISQSLAFYQLGFILVVGATSNHSKFAISTWRVLECYHVNNDGFLRSTPPRHGHFSRRLVVGCSAEPLCNRSISTLTNHGRNDINEHCSIAWEFVPTLLGKGT